MNGTADTTSTTGWTKRSDGTWEATVDGVLYLIDRDNDNFNLYRYLGYEYLDTDKDLITLMCVAENF